MTKLLPLLFAVFCGPWLAIAEAPSLDISQALKVAQDYLRDQGLADRVSISGLVLQQTSLTSKETFWYARWSPPVTVEKKTESGLRINMDGSIVRMTSGIAGFGGFTSGGRADNPGQRHFGARDMR